MGKEKRRIFSREFKLEAVRMCEGRSTAEVARSLGINGNVLYRWRQAMEGEGADAFRGNGNRTSLEEENRRLKQENQQLRLEAEILKKAAAYFAKHIR